MLRATVPYLLIGLAISVAAAWAYRHGHLGVLGSYGVLAVATMISLIGYVRWDLREHGRPSRRR